MSNNSTPKFLRVGKVVCGGNPRKLRKQRTRLYQVWCKMRERCRNPNHVHFKDYGGRGIKVCKAWDDFTRFRGWALSNGFSKGLQLDRVNCNGNYSPQNCQWVTPQENARNRRTSKVTLESAAKIKASLLPSKKAARLFKVSVSHITKIRAGKVWADA